MKKKRKIVITCICIALAVIILAGAVLGGAVLSAKLISVVINSHSNIFFLMPRSYIKNKLTEEFPLGSSVEEVSEKIEEHKWKRWHTVTVSDVGIIYRSDGDVECNSGRVEPGDRVVGTQHLEVQIGCGWWNSTYVFFAFDENDKLIDIAVRKTFAVE